LYETVIMHSHYKLKKHTLNDKKKGKIIQQETQSDPRG
jgi:hypothetical protein